MQPDPHLLIDDGDDDAHWADLLSPARRRLIASAGLAAGGLASASTASASPHGDVAANTPEPGRPGFRAIVPPAPKGRTPRAYTDIKSYHAHIYFDEDSFEKAALLRRWAAERFPVELGNWNLEPRGPHVTPSFYFGFNNDLLPVLVPWLQLNSLGLTILIHPNTGDGRADHLYYALWVNRAQPVNAYNWPVPKPGEREALEEVFPNVVPTVPLET